MVSAIVRELESGGEAEISSEAIGEIVMEHLRQLDDVAYVRFASVYRNFREAKDFEDRARRALRRGRRAARRDTQMIFRILEDQFAQKIREAQGRRPPLHAAGAGARPARAGAHLAQSGRRRGRRQGRRHRRPRLDPAGRPPACRARGAAARRRGGARRHALCHARAVLAFRQVAALRRRDHRRRHRARGGGDRGSQSGSRGAGPCAAARRRHRRRCRACARRRPRTTTPGISAASATSARM